MTYILVTNDDGVRAPGLLALATAMRALGEVRVIAPSINQSAIGHKKTLFQEIEVTETQLADGTPAHAVNGSPADCIALASLGLIEWPPDIVVSGINAGPNLAQDITYSGTVTAALEAAINGVQAIAVSLDKRNAAALEAFQPAAQIAVKVVARTLEKGLPPQTILNLNVPRGKKIKGVKITRQGVRVYLDELARDSDTIFRIVGPEPGGNITDEGTDMWAVHQGYASLTPIHLDMTAHLFMAKLAAWDIQL